jgi:hypothetical protein
MLRRMRTLVALVALIFLPFVSPTLVAAVSATNPLFMLASHLAQRPWTSSNFGSRTGVGLNRETLVARVSVTSLGLKQVSPLDPLRNTFRRSGRLKIAKPVRVPDQRRLGALTAPVTGIVASRVAGAYASQLTGRTGSGR